MLQIWKNIVLNWIDCYFNDTAKKEQSVNVETIHVIISHLRENLNLDESKSSILEANSIEEFLSEKYPEFKFENGSLEPSNEDEFYIVASLLLYFVCTNSKDLDIKNAMCSKLCIQDQEIILKYSRNLMEVPLVQYKDVHAAIIEACQDIAISCPPLRSLISETPPALRSLHSEVRRLQAALDAERFDRTFLQEELSRNNLRVEKLLKDKEQNKLEILNLKAKISLSCGDDKVPPSQSGDTNSTKLLKQLQDLEERLIHTQEQLEEVQYDRDSCKVKLSELKQEREKLYLLTQESATRIDQLQEELDTEKRLAQSYKELIYELRIHNQRNFTDNSQLEWDDLETSIHTLPHNTSNTSEVVKPNISNNETTLKEELHSKLSIEIEQMKAQNNQINSLFKQELERNEQSYNEHLLEKQQMLQKYNELYAIKNEIEGTLRSKNELVDELQKDIMEKNQQLVNLQNDVALLNNEIVNQNETFKQTVANLNAELDKLHKNEHHLQRTIEKNKSDMEANTSGEVVKSNISNSETTLKEELNSKLIIEIEQMKAENNHINSLLKQEVERNEQSYNEHLLEKQQMLQKYNELYAVKNEIEVTLRNKNVLVDELQKDIMKKNQQLVNLQNDVALLNNEIVNQNETFQQTVANLNAELDKLHKNEHHLQRTIEKNKSDMEANTSGEVVKSNISNSETTLKEELNSKLIIEIEQMKAENNHINSLLKQEVERNEQSYNEHLLEKQQMLQKYNELYAVKNEIEVTLRNKNVLVDELQKDIMEKNQQLVNLQNDVALLNNEIVNQNETFKQTVANLNAELDKLHKNEHHLQRTIEKNKSDMEANTSGEVVKSNISNSETTLKEELNSKLIIEIEQMKAENNHINSLLKQEVERNEQSYNEHLLEKQQMLQKYNELYAVKNEIEGTLRNKNVLVDELQKDIMEKNQQLVNLQNDVALLNNEIVNQNETFKQTVANLNAELDRLHKNEHHLQRTIEKNKSDMEANTSGEVVKSNISNSETTLKEELNSKLIIEIEQMKAENNHINSLLKQEVERNEQSYNEHLLEKQQMLQKYNELYAVKNEIEGTLRNKNVLVDELQKDIMEKNQQLVNLQNDVALLNNEIVNQNETFKQTVANLNAELDRLHKNEHHLQRTIEKNKSDMEANTSGEVVKSNISNSETTLKEELNSKLIIEIEQMKAENNHINSLLKQEVERNEQSYNEHLLEKQQMLQKYNELYAVKNEIEGTLRNKNVLVDELQKDIMEKNQQLVNLQNDVALLNNEIVNQNETFKQTVANLNAELDRLHKNEHHLQSTIEKNKSDMEANTSGEVVKSNISNSETTLKEELNSKLIIEIEQMKAENNHINSLLKQEVERNEQSYNEHLPEKQQMLQKYNELYGVKNEIEVTLRSKNVLVDELQKDIMEKNQQLVNLQNDVALLNNEIVNQNETFKQTVANLNAELDKLHKNEHHLQRTIEKNKSDMEANTSGEVVKSNISNSETTLKEELNSKLIIEIEQMKAENNHINSLLKQEVERNEQSYNEHLLEKQQILQKHNELYAVKNEIEGTLRTKNVLVDELQKDIMEKNLQLENLQNDVALLNNEIVNQNETFKQTVANLNAELDKLHKNEHHLQRTIEKNKSDMEDLEKIIHDKNRAITTLRCDLNYMTTLMAESENKLLDVNKELEITRENCDQLSNQLKKIVNQKNDEIADFKKQLNKMSFKLSAKYQAIILKRIAELKSNTVLKELQNIGNAGVGDHDLRRGLNVGSITMDDLENFLETTERNLQRFSEKQIALQKERDRLYEVSRIKESEIISLKKFLTELSVSFKTFSSVKEIYSQKLSKVVSIQRTVRREILNSEGRITDAAMCKLERGYAAVMQDLVEAVMNIERWVERCLGRTISPEKIKQAFTSEVDSTSLSSTSYQNAGLEVQLEELEKSFQKLLEEVSHARRGEGSKDAQSVTVMEVRAEYEDKLNRMKAKMKQLYEEQIAKFKEKQKREIADLNNELHKAKENFTESSRAYEEHIRALTTELWSVGEKFLIQKDEAEWLRKQRSGSLMSLQHYHSTAAGAAAEEPCRPSDTASLRSLPVIPSIDNKPKKREGRGLHMSDEEGEVFDNRCLKELTSTPRASLNPGKRLSELQWRNSLCPPHLKSSYPAETQFAMAVQEEDIKHSLGPTATLPGRHQRKEVGITAYKKPGPPTPSKQAGRLSAMDSELRESLRVEMDPHASRKTSTPSRLRSLFRSSRNDTSENTPRRRLSNIFRKK